jgi:hypothetical protein
MPVPSPDENLRRVGVPHPVKRLNSYRNTNNYIYQQGPVEARCNGETKNQGNGLTTGGE